MKKLLITMTMSLVCVWAYGQGAVSFDLGAAAYEIYFSSDSSKLATADRGTIVNTLPLAGQSAYTGNILWDPQVNPVQNGGPGTIASLAPIGGNPATFIAGLYGGASSSTMILQTTTTILDQDFAGQIDTKNVYPSTFGPGGTPNVTGTYVWEVQVWEYLNVAVGSDFGVGGAAATAWADGYYAGASPTFFATLNSTVQPSIWDHALPSDNPPGAQSSWAPGTYQLTDDPGYQGNVELMVQNIPEPGSFALAGLGIAALLVFRRRK